MLAHVAATQHDPKWREVLTIGREDLAVTTGAVVAALVMAVAALADLDAEAALTWCVGLGLVAVATLSFYATANHRPAVRVVMAGFAALLGAVIVVLENTF